MGEDKALLPFGSYKTLTQYQFQRLSQIFQNVYISTKNPKKFTFKAEFIVDEREDNYSPLNGFLAIFEQLQADSVFVMSVDTPFISDLEIKKLVEADKANNDATVAQTKEKIHPLCGIYHRSIFQEILRMFVNNRHKLTELLKNTNCSYVSFENERAFLNLNRPSDYQEAVSILNS